MEKISIKTPNPKCRLYWCLIEFIYWRYSQSCGFFDPSCELAPPNLLTGSPTPPPPPCEGICVHTVCNGGIRGLRHINTCRQVPLLVNFLRKADI
jgi:hypothetical protein